jgi:thimet oligopeptidase
MHERNRFLLCGLAAVLLASMPAAARVTLPIQDAPGVEKACKDGLARARAGVAELERMASGRPSGEVLRAWDRVTIARENFENVDDLMSNVSPDKAVRTAADACLLESNRFSSELFQNEKLYKRILAVKPASPIEAKMRKDILDAFEDTGVSLPPEKRARMKQILDRLEEIRQEFGRDIRDNKTRLTFTPEEMKGLPKDYLDRAKRDDKGNYVLGFEYPEYEPFMANADNAEARRRFQFAFSNRGTPRNLELLAEAMRLRKEIAGFFDLPSYAHFALRRRMAETPEAVEKFLDDVKAAVRDVERKELGELAALKAGLEGRKPEEVKVNRWDLAYLHEKLKKSRYDIDQEAMRKYFPTDASVNWVMHISSTLYGIRLVPAKVPVWHEDVQYYDVVDAKSGKTISGIYLDLFPREGKFTHAAAWPVYSSSRIAQRTPISALVANLNRGGLTHDELETLVHEFGHVMHGVLSSTDYATQGGTTVERDFVEAPSQMYEEWDRRMESLGQLKQFCTAECPAVDNALLKRLEAARLYGSGMRYSRQHLYAAYDMATSSATLSDPLATWEKMEGETPTGYVPGTQSVGAFEHIISGYTAGYYGYMWSQVLALDMLSAYGNNLMDVSVGRRFRDTILSQGSQKKAAEMVRNFLGREPSNQAFFAEITGTRSSLGLGAPKGVQ